MRVLIVHGSKMGATAGIAETMAVAFADRGLVADVRPADAAPAPGGYDAVIVGSALYAGHWLPEPRRYVERHADELRRAPVWLFSSGPLDHSAEDHRLAAVSQVEHLRQLVDARGHETFGGKLDREDAVGIVAKLMARTRSGDWRDQQHIARWVDDIATALEAQPHEGAASAS